MYVWGVDPSTKRLAIADSGPDDVRVVSAQLGAVATGQSGERLSEIREGTRRIVRTFAAVRAPVAIWVEQPSGGHVNPISWYTVGVMMEVMFDEFGVPVWPISSSKWKKEAIGYGLATKRQIAAWVAARGIEVANQDEADAAAIAIYGRAAFFQRTVDATVV